MWFFKTSDDIKELWKFYIKWLKVKIPTINANLNPPISSVEKRNLEEVLGSSIPESLLEILNINNGQKEYPGVFLGANLMTSKEIADEIKRVKGLRKYQNTIPGQILDKTNSSIKSVIDLCLSLTENPKTIKFEINKSGYSFPIWIDDTDKIVMVFESKTEAHQKFKDLISNIYKNEKPYHNWDKMEVVWLEGQMVIERSFYTTSTNFTSYPEKAIKTDFVNSSWIPFLHDGGGNFIGIDNDPDINGAKGQIINWGRDEHDRFVIAKDLKEFLSFIKDQIQKGIVEKTIVEEEEGRFSFGLEKQSHFWDDLKKRFKLN